MAIGSCFRMTAFLCGSGGLGLCLRNSANWYPDYLFKKILPKIKAAGVTDEQIRGIFVENPRRFFGGV